MPVPTRRERYAHRARWRPVPMATQLTQPDSRTPLASGRAIPGRCTPPPASRRDSHFSSAELDLPQIFAPAAAAEILRHLGLTEMTECALRTRAYRRQVPFHLNGRRIRFTAGDLREIVESHPRRAQSADATSPRPTRSQPARRSMTRHADHPPQTWRARQSRATSAAEGQQPQ
jgi:hypothetical protein